jgi:hypothetical protein
VTAIGNDGPGAALGCDRAGVAGAVWRTIAVGTYRSATALHDALVTKGVHVGDLAGQMLRLPAFRLVSAPTRIDLTLLAVRELVPGSARASFGW